MVDAAVDEPVKEPAREKEMTILDTRPNQHSTFNSFDRLCYKHLVSANIPGSALKVLMTPLLLSLFHMKSV